MVNAATLNLESLDHRDEDGFATPCGPYSPGWGKTLGRVYEELTWERDGQAAVRRAMRRMRRDRARDFGVPMRLRIVMESGVSRHSIYWFDPEVMEVYGWRAALVAVRALRKEAPSDPYETGVSFTVTDARLDALRESDGWDDLLPPI